LVIENDDMIWTPLCPILPDQKWRISAIFEVFVELTDVAIHALSMVFRRNTYNLYSIIK